MIRSFYSPIQNSHRNSLFLILAIVGIFGLGGYLLYYFECLRKQEEPEEEIKKERDSLHNLFDSMADAVLVISSDYQVEFMNQTAISRFNDQIGKQCYQVLCGCDYPCSGCQFSNQTPSTGSSSERTLAPSTGSSSKRTLAASTASTGSSSKQTLTASTGSPSKQTLAASTGSSSKQTLAASTGSSSEQTIAASTGSSSKRTLAASNVSSPERTLAPSTASTGSPSEQTLAASGCPSSERTLFRCHDNNRDRWYEVSAAPLIRNDQTKSIVAIIRDVTKEKELEEKLIASEKKYRTLVNHTKDLIMVQDFQGTVLLVSESVENLLGYRMEEFCHHPFQQFLTENPTNDSWRKEIHEPGDLQCRMQPHLLECKTRQGNKILLEANESAIFEREGQDEQIMGVYRDITERKRLEEQLLESERLRMLSLTKRFCYGEIIGRNPKMQEIYELIEAVSQSKAIALIQGESGTGKELAARAIHYLGVLAKGPFIGISCSVLSENLLESELFGHVRGAFTGAIKDKTGRFELANGGTLFLDEVGDMSLTIQIKLLRVLQEREFEKVGGEKTVKVDVRIIAATNKDLKEEVARGKFREDLFYRLNVVEIRLPPLRERMDDLPLLVTHFIEKFNLQTNKGITNLSKDAMRTLSHYPWPGNVRELEHVIEHAFIRCNKSIILPRHLPPDVTEHKAGNIIRAGVKNGLSKDEIERDILLNTLEELGWNLGLVIQKLNISRPTLWRKMKKYGLSHK